MAIAYGDYEALLKEREEDARKKKKKKKDDNNHGYSMSTLNRRLGQGGGKKSSY